MTISTESLERKIENAVEQLVRDHLIALEAITATAVRAGFRRATQQVSTKQRDGESASRRRSMSQRRPHEVMETLAEQLYQAVCADPGETMTVLARVVGSTPRELKRPAMVLRSSGRVRSVGHRHSTRYFPMGS